jgi:hypothetical protein
VKSSALYDARQHATPSQLRALQARNDRKAWLELLAKQDKPVSCQSASERNAAVPDLERRVLGGGRSYREVFERAARQHPIELSQPAQEQPAPWFFIVSEGYGPFVSIEQIQRAVVDQFKTVTRRDLMCKRREARIVHCRQIAFYVCKALTKKSFPEIGRMFGGFDHTTIMYSIKKVERLIWTDPAYAQDVGEIINNLGCRDT